MSLNWSYYRHAPCRVARQTERMQMHGVVTRANTTLGGRERVQWSRSWIHRAGCPDGLMESRASDGRALHRPWKTSAAGDILTQPGAQSEWCSVHVSPDPDISTCPWKINHSCKSFCCDLAKCVPSNSDILRAELDFFDTRASMTQWWAAASRVPAWLGLKSRCTTETVLVKPRNLLIQMEQQVHQPEPVDSIPSCCSRGSSPALRLPLERFGEFQRHGNYLIKQFALCSSTLCKTS